MSLTGFNMSHFGKIKKLRTDLDAHAILTAGIHGAVAAATASKLIIRDANARSRVAAPPASDNTDLIANTAWVQTELAGIPLGTVTSVGSGTGLSGGPITGSGSLSLDNTAVTPGIFNFAVITVDAQGRITAASNGSPVTSVGATGPITSSGGATPSIGIPASSASVDGYMAKADKSKLDAIASGAQVNAVSSVFGRSGAVIAISGDYTVQKISGITVSISAPTGGSNGDIWFQV